MTAPRPVRLRMIAAHVALGVLLAACAPGGTSPPPVVMTGGAAPGTLVMIIRHGEKPAGSADVGVDAEGDEDSSSLTATGWERADRLADLFDPAPGAPRPGLARPTAIYAAGATDDGEGVRTRETVAPLVERLDLPANTEFGKGEELALVEHVLGRPGSTLISWQHEGMPVIAAAFPGVTPSPPAQWPDDRFDVVWTLTRTADGWHFAQVPELALPQDRADTIEN